nr:13791_t:CDS:2 [Entrophospora candida]
MGAVISRFRSQNNDNYEKILSELDDNIRKAEVRLGEIRIRERNALIIWIVYSLLAYVAYVMGYWYFVYMSNEEENWDFMKVAPVLTGPFFIVIGYRFLALWYKRKETNEISQLEHLRARQSLKVEELKKRTGYYTTKTLLERYDSPTKPMTPGQKIPLITTPGSLKSGAPQQQLQSLINPNSLRQPSIDKTNIQNQRHWYDKLVDAIVGEDEQKYALICKNCYTWNGLAFASEFDDIQYYCKNCNHFNTSRRSLRNGTSSAPPPPTTSSRGRSTTPKPTTSRSTSRKRKGSHGSRRGSTDDDFEDNEFKPYNVRDDEIGNREE